MSSDTHYSNYVLSAIQQKLRQSCNRCSAQKIRCSKERPTCGRCAAKNLSCNYSVSQRTGKRMSISNPSPQLLRNEAPAPVIEPTSSPMVPVEGGNSMAIVATSEPSTVIPTDMADTMSTIFMSDFTFEPPEGFSVPPRELDLQHETPNLPNRTPHSNSFPQLPTPNITSYFAEPNAGVEEFPLHAQGQDCMALALDLINSLHVLSSTCALAVPTAAATHSPPSSETWGPRKDRRAIRGMDYVLIKNRATIKTLHRIMQCSCSRDRSMAFICSLVMEKILRWYRAGTRDFEEDEETNGESECLPEQVMSLPIYMGEYRLYSVSQRLMRANLVLDELRTQMKPLIEKFTKRFCSLQLDPENLAQDALASSCCDLDKHLRQRLREVAKEAGDSDII